MVEPDSLDFCSGNIGANLAERHFVITNAGDGLLTGRIFDAAPIFRFRDVPSGYTYALAGGESDTIRVVFDPAGEIFHDGVIEFEDSSCGNIPCHGHGQYSPDAGDPYCMVITPFDQFTPPTYVGQSVSGTLYIDNLGGGYLTGSLAEACGDFSIEWPCDFMITGRQKWRVWFTPTVSGEHLCVMSTGGPCEIGFGAVAIDSFPSCQVIPDTISFAPVQVGQSSYGHFRIVNTGNDTLRGLPLPCGDFWMGAGSGSYELMPGDSQSMTVRFSPLSPGEQTCILDSGDRTCDDVVLIGTGIEPSLDQDVIGIYFEQSGQQNIYDTTVPNELVTAYLMILNPSSSYGIGGWECCIEAVGGADPIWYELPEGSVNVDTPPCFAVGMSGLPLGGDAIIVATVNFIQASPDEATYFYIHPTTNPSIPGVPSYADGLDPGHLIPLAWSSGSEEQPVAKVNDPLTAIATVPEVTTLHANYPNPFNPATCIRFELAQSSHVNLAIYDLAGKRIRGILDRRLLAGRHEHAWDGRGGDGRSMPAGVYFYRLRAGAYDDTKKMILLK